MVTDIDLNAIEKIETVWVVTCVEVNADTNWNGSLNAQAMYSVFAATTRLDDVDRLIHEAGIGMTGVAVQEVQLVS